MMEIIICTIIKNELEYLEEWILHNINLGFDAIYLYEDIDSKSHSYITDKYSQVHLNSITSVIEDINCPHRLIALHDWFLEKTDFGDWVAFIDVDEFILVKNKSLKEFLESKQDNLLMRWLYMKADGRILKSNLQVQESYTTFYNGSFKSYFIDKSIVNRKYYTGWDKYIHNASNSSYIIDESGDMQIYIKHYFTKSWEDWKQRILERGDILTNLRNIGDFFIINKEMKHLKPNLLLEIASGKEYDESDTYIHIFTYGELPDLKLLDYSKLYPKHVLCTWNINSIDINDSPELKKAYRNRQIDVIVDYWKLWCLYHFGGVVVDTQDKFLEIDKLNPTIKLKLDNYFN